MARVIVVGAGVAGLLSAYFAARKGHDVKVLTYGLGALTVAGGIIDVFAYDGEGRQIADPLEHIKKLPETHPYALIGAQQVERALEAFKELTREQNYPYIGDAHHNLAVPTAIGSFKPSCLIPPSIDGEAIFRRKKLIVVGFELLKDYYPKLIEKNLKRYFKDTKEISVKTVSLNWPSGRGYRDVSALDIARALESSDIECLNVIQQLKNVCDSDTALIMPPVLAEMPEKAGEVLARLEQGLNGAKPVEVSSMPPSVTGLRLDKLLRRAVTGLGVEIIEKAQVIGSNVKDGRCLSLLTGGFGRVREYKADHFIIATGGVFGNGLVSGMGRMIEPVFNIEIDVPPEQKDWSYQYLFCGKPQPFASYGVRVNRRLSPVDPTGAEILHNVHFAGRSLAGYDFCFEKSGNGVCVASAYHAACMLDSDVQA